MTLLEGNIELVDEKYKVEKTFGGKVSTRAMGTGPETPDI